MTIPSKTKQTQTDIPFGWYLLNACNQKQKKKNLLDTSVPSIKKQVLIHLPPSPSDQWPAGKSQSPNRQHFVSHRAEAERRVRLHRAV